MTRFFTRKAAVVTAVIFGVLGMVFGGFTLADAATSTAVAKTAAPSNLYGCIGGSNRELIGNYTVAANFKTCPAGSFAVTIASGANGKNGLNGAAGAKGATGVQGPKGDTGATGPAGVAGTNGTDGASGLSGAYYAEAKYDVGDTNGGAVATVACKSHSDVAISGGVQTLAAGTNGLTGNVPVSSSFAGRMDWSTNTPIPGDLSGWVVQFGGNSSSTSLGDPHYEDIYALCVPSTTIPVDVTYTESGS